MTKDELLDKTRHIKIETEVEKFDLIDADVYLDLLNKYNDLQQENIRLTNAFEKVMELVRVWSAFPTNELDNYKFKEDLLEILEGI